ARHNRVPAIGALSSRGLAGSYVQARAAVEHSCGDSTKLILSELAFHPYAELGIQPMGNALKASRQLTVRCQELQPSIDAGHGTDGDEPPSRAAGQPVDQSAA